MKQYQTLLEIEAELRTAADYFNSDAWISLSEEYPRDERCVLVRMSNGKVEMGSWDAAAKKWKFRPFSVGSTPVAWTELPMLEERSSYKSGTPWLGNLDKSWR